MGELKATPQSPTRRSSKRVARGRVQVTASDSERDGGFGVFGAELSSRRRWRRQTWPSGQGLIVSIGINPVTRNLPSELWACR